MNGKSSQVSLAIGTKNMETNFLRAPDICKIIKACADAGVLEFSHNGILIKFQAPRNELAFVHGPAQDFPVEVSEISKENTKQADAFDRAQLLDTQEAQLLIDDPYAFEQIQMDQDIERNRELDEKAFN